MIVSKSQSKALHSSVFNEEEWNPMNGSSHWYGRTHSGIPSSGAASQPLFHTDTTFKIDILLINQVLIRFQRDLNLSHYCMWPHVCGSQDTWPIFRGCLCAKCSPQPCTSITLIWDMDSRSSPENLELLGSAFLKSTQGNFYAPLHFLTLVWGMEQMSRPLGKKLLRKPLEAGHGTTKRKKKTETGVPPSAECHLLVTSCIPSTLTLHLHRLLLKAHNTTVRMRMQSWRKKNKEVVALRFEPNACVLFLFHTIPFTISPEWSRR